MAPMKCPDCGAQRFYIKDPEDQYNIFEFDLKDGEVFFSDLESDTDPPRVVQETETYCDRCAWHDRFETLQKPR